MTVRLDRPAGPAALKPFRYYGAKARLAPLIVSMMPTHRIYLEPFLGSATVLCAKPAAPQELVNDLDGRIVNFFQVLRERPDQLAEACRLTPYARGEYDRCRTEPWPDDPLEAARRFWVLTNHSYAGSTRGKTGFSISMRQSVNRARVTMNKVDQLRVVADRFQNVQIDCAPAWDVIDRHGRHDEPTVIYCDPPYVHGTRSGNDVRGYRHEMTDDDHRRLAQSLRATSATVLLSGYANPLYDAEFYPDWWRHEIPATTGAGRGRPRIEVIWSNRPLLRQTSIPLDLAEGGGIDAA